MDILGLKKHKVVEVNQSTGLRTGKMVAQSAFDNSTAALEFLDNGHILELDHKDELILSATGEATQLYLHYSEEHYKLINNYSLDMFTVPLTDGVKAYPRAIALEDNDRFTTDNFAGGEAMEREKFYIVTVVDGVLTVGLEATSAHKGAVATLGTLPNGKKAIKVIWRGA